MLRSAYRLMARVSPKLAHVARESYFTLNGWRFDDLKRYMNQNQAHSGATSLALSHSFSSALQPQAAAERRIAFVSCLLPMDTGIATCSLYSWMGFEGPVDIFAPAIDMDWYFAQERMLRGRGNGPRLFDVGAFMTLDQVMQYDRIVIAVGNSNHHDYIFSLLRKLSSFGGTDRIVLYIHDPCLLNIVAKGTESSPKELLDLMTSIYKRKIDVNPFDPDLHLKMVSAGMLGIRFFNNIGIDKFLVNSETARQMVLHDLGEAPATIEKIFHPVFLPQGADTLDDDPPDDSALVVGAFGVIDFGKRIDHIADTMRSIGSKGINARLLLAGFHVRGFVETHPEIFEGVDYELFDSPTDRQLVACMKKCHVAIQLRKHALGESSGIVPQLMMQKKTVLVSDIGAFAEYGEAVVKVAPDETAEETARKLIAAAAAPIKPAILERYCNERSAAAFQRSFMNIYGQPSPRMSQVRSEIPSAGQPTR